MTDHDVPPEVREAIEEAAVEKIAAILRPFIDHELAHHDEDTDVGPHEQVRTIVRAALEKIGTGGLGRCRLCLS